MRDQLFDFVSLVARLAARVRACAYDEFRGQRTCVCGCLIGTVAAAFLPADLYLGSQMHIETSVILCSVIIAFINGRYTLVRRTLAFQPERVRAYNMRTCQSIFKIIIMYAKYTVCGPGDIQMQRASNKPPKYADCHAQDNIVCVFLCARALL